MKSTKILTYAVSFFNNKTLYFLMDLHFRKTFLLFIYDINYCCYLIKNIFDVKLFQECSSDAKQTQFTQQSKTDARSTGKVSPKIGVLQMRLPTTVKSGIRQMKLCHRSVLGARWTPQPSFL